MHMWDSTTCACGTARHVHVKQDCSPGKGTFLPEKAKVQHRAVMCFPHGEVRQTMVYRNADENKFTQSISSLKYSAAIESAKICDHLRFNKTLSHSMN